MDIPVSFSIFSRSDAVLVAHIRNFCYLALCSLHSGDALAQLRHGARIPDIFAAETGLGEEDVEVVVAAGKVLDKLGGEVLLGSDLLARDGVWSRTIAAEHDEGRGILEGLDATAGCQEQGRDSMKKRRLDPTPVEELTFDPSARNEYLTGFHKRKQARIENARETAKKRDKEEKVRERQEMRKQKKEDLEKHVREVNQELRKQNPDLDVDGGEEEDSDEGEGEEWKGFEEGDAKDGLGEDEEYVDEDKYTTVTVEAMGGSDDDDEREEDSEEPIKAAASAQVAEQKTANGDVKTEKKRTWSKKNPNEKPKQKKHKFRYESKAERQVTRQQQKKKNSKAAKARREKGGK
ncbi:hypothetical protein D0868_05128 [Hortaea werneckii]|uniref:Uncharacterized protein n=1 Tax=Hortaea werneckii TaxID=91943 RepID=A0A3M7B7C4_HORWE|nr:hypothetical protein D0868_05128 [Hortaea werneckii]RMY35752.1 hypothetical protein D0866_04387 [Hortaea werneckii]